MSKITASQRHTIIELVWAGCTNGEIAHQTGIDIHTVANIAQSARGSKTTAPRRCRDCGSMVTIMIESRCLGCHMIEGRK